MWPHRRRDAHLNIEVKLMRVPTSTDKYDGVLGRTVRRMGSTGRVDKRTGGGDELSHKSSRAATDGELNKRLIRDFMVTSLFPVYL